MTLPTRELAVRRAEGDGHVAHDGHRAGYRLALARQLRQQPRLVGVTLWYQDDVRVFAAGVALALCAACGQPTTPSAGSSFTESDAVDPANVARVRTELPEGYEVADLTGRASPLAFWGLEPQWSADPPQCGALADLGPGAEPVHGWSASGAGGIVYVVVVDTPVKLDPALVESCRVWTVSAGHTSGLVTLVAPPTIEGVPTVGMVTDATTVVEGGTETHSRADTFSAYLDGHVAYVTVVTDPGSPDAALGADFAARLLAKTVTAVRGG